MPAIKDIALQAIQSLPEDSSLDTIIDEIIYRAKIAEGMRDMREGKTVSIDEIKKEYGIIS